MGRSKVNRLQKKGTHFIWEERLILQRLLYKSKVKSLNQIASILGKSKRTIQREIKRGWEEFLSSELIPYDAYSPDVAQRLADENLQSKGPQLKLGNDFTLVNDISGRITNDQYSPDAIIMFYTKNGWPSSTKISVRTLYRYIDENLIPNVQTEDLLHKGKRKRRHLKHPRRHARAASARKSIELRPGVVDARKEVGHWEMDCVVSGKNKGSSTLLTLTERSKRYQIIRRMKEKSSASVVLELDKLERKIGAVKFRKIFQTITCDNGSEFMDSAALEKSCLCKKLRTDLYYAHPYSSSERGSNENANGIIRRFIPKGSAISDYSNLKIKEIQDWMNNYPRRILGQLSAREAFQYPEIA